jgi:hypothetical protein
VQVKVVELEWVLLHRMEMKADDGSRSSMSGHLDVGGGALAVGEITGSHGVSRELHARGTRARDLQKPPTRR